MHNIRVVQATGHRHGHQFGTGQRLDADKQTVVRVVDQTVAADIRAHTSIVGREQAGQLEGWCVEVRFLEAVRVRRNSSIGTLGDGIESDRRARANDVDWIDDL